MSNIEVIRHSLAHVMAAAVQKLWPDVKFAGGPAIENGFYYDLDMEHKITEEDFAKIEKEMRDLIKSDGTFVMRDVSIIEAREIFKDQPYKLEWIDDIGSRGGSVAPESKITIYKFRDFTDLCRGPHVASSKELPRDSWKLRSVAGAYWKGDSKNKMLQRVYADAFATAAELAGHLHMMEEAAKRDHRKIGREMDLFHFEPEYAPGAVFWHDKGWRLYRRLIEFVRARQERAGYTEISTPGLMDRCLWEISGHWDKYGEHNYSGSTEDGRQFCVKPMSCPGGMLVWAHGQKSYKDLPMYVAEFGHVHRYEAAGGLHGLMRVREFTQDDAHIYCTPDQVEAEVVKTIRFIQDTYKILGFNDVHMKLATRKNNEFRIGSDEIWDMAEGALKSALEKNNIPYTVEPEDAAFYGPKVDIYLKDSVGRIWQCGTIQMDMNLPERFDLTYVGADGEKHRPIMLHRALSGSLDRFLGIFIENTAGHFPLWISPEPVVVVPVSEKFDDAASALVAELRAVGVYARADLRSETVPYKVRDLSVIKTPIIAVLGEKEIADNTVAVRKLGIDSQEVVKRDAFIADMKEQVKLPV